MLHTKLTADNAQTRTVPAWTKTDAFILIALFLLGLLLALTVTLRWLDIHDDGLYMHQANVVLRGGAPYVDYFSHDPPLGNLWHALMLALFGNDLFVLRVAILPFKALLLPAIYALARPLVPRGPAVLAALVVPVVDTTNFYMVAHVGLNALALAFVVVILLMLWARRQHPAWLFAAGITLGLMAGFKQNMGLYLLGAAVVWLIDPKAILPASNPVDKSLVKQTTDDGRRTMAVVSSVVRRPSSGGRTRWLLVGVWVSAVACVLWLVRANIEPTVLTALVLPIAALAIAAMRARYDADLAWAEALKRWLILGAGFLVITLPWLAWAASGVGIVALINNLLIAPGNLPEIWFGPLRAPVEAFWRVAGLYAGGVIVTAGLLALTRLLGGKRPALAVAWVGMALWFAAMVAVTPPEAVEDGLIYVWIYFGLLVFWPAFVMIERLPPDPSRAHARLLLITAAFLALEMYPQLRRVNANWCLPLFLPLAAWLLWQAQNALRRLAAPAIRKQTASVSAAALIVLPVMALGWILTWRVSQFIDLPNALSTGRLTPIHWTRLNLPHYRIWETPANSDLYSRVADAIRERTKPNEPIYCLYRPIIFYLAAERPPAVRNVYAPPRITRQEGESMRAELERAGVRVMLVDNTMFLPEGPRDYYFSNGSNVEANSEWVIPIKDYVVEHFRKVEDLNQWSLWERQSISEER